MTVKTQPKYVLSVVSEQFIREIEDKTRKCPKTSFKCENKNKVLSLRSQKKS